ncbi:MAG: RNA polymerase sigma factor, partial [Oscillospiraceae bacterium]
LRRNTVNIDELIIPFEDKKDIELTQLVFSLPPKQRDVIYLYYYEQYKVGEIAELTGMKENTVKSHLKRGREQLKKYLLE